MATKVAFVAMFVLMAVNCFDRCVVECFQVHGQTARFDESPRGEWLFEC